MRTARLQTIVGIAIIIPLLIVGIVPLVSNDVLMENLLPLAPMTFDDAGA